MLLDLWEAEFEGRKRSLVIAAEDLDKAIEIMKGSLQWRRRKKYPFRGIKRVSLVHTAPSVESPREALTPEPMYTIWDASWLPQPTSEPQSNSHCDNGDPEND